MDAYLDIVVRSLCVYLFMIFGIRLFGKNELSQLNAGDVILLLLISNAVQNAMVGENTSLQGGLVAALVLFLANFILKKYLFKNKKVRQFLESEPKILIKDGILNNENLKSQDVSLEELEEAVREHGVEKISDVKLSILEVDGNISVISFNNLQTSFSRHRRIFPKKSHKL